MFKVQKLSNPEFDKYVTKNSDLYIPIEQSYLYDGYDLQMGDRRILGIYGYYDKNDNLICTTRLTYYKLPMRNILFCTKGPIWFTRPSQSLESQLIQTMKRYFSEENKYCITFIRMWIKYPTNYGNKSFEDVLADREIWVEIDKSKEDLLMSFRRSTRQRIKQAIKCKNLEIKEIFNKKERINIFKKDLIQILNQLGKDKKFYIHPSKVYTSILKGIPDNSRLYIAYLNNIPVSWSITTEYNNFATYLFAAGNRDSRKFYTAYLMQYRIMCDMQKRGNKLYNLTGIESKNYPSLKSLTEFKKGFSKNIVNLPIVYDIPIDKIKYKIITNLINLHRKIRNIF